MRQNLAGTVADDEAAGGACQGGDCGGGGVGGRGGGGGHPVQEELALTVPGLIILLQGDLQVQVTNESSSYFLIPPNYHHFYDQKLLPTTLYSVSSLCSNQPQNLGHGHIAYSRT